MKPPFASSPTTPTCTKLLGEADQKVSRSDAATKAFEGALQRNPNSAIALYSLGSMKVQSGKPEEGVQLLRKAEALHARPAPTDFYLGLGLAERGQTAEAAMQWLERSLANQPSPFIQQSAYYQLARAYQKLDRKSRCPTRSRPIAKTQKPKRQRPSRSKGSLSNSSPCSRTSDTATMSLLFFSPRALQLQSGSNRLSASFAVTMFEACIAIGLQAQQPPVASTVLAKAREATRIASAGQAAESLLRPYLAAHPNDPEATHVVGVTPR